VTIQELPTEVPVGFEDVERSRSTAQWSVSGGGWKQLLPDLPDDVIELLAMPVVVTASSLAPRHASPVAETPRGDAGISGGPAECMPMFLAPAPRTRSHGRHARA